MCPLCDTTVHARRAVCVHSPTHMRGSTPPRVLHFSAFHSNIVDHLAVRFINAKQDTVERTNSIILYAVVGTY